MRMGNMWLILQQIRDLPDRFVGQGHKTFQPFIGPSAVPTMTLGAGSTKPQDATQVIALVGLKEASLHRIQIFIRDEGGEILRLEPTALNAYDPIARAKPDHVIIDLEAVGGIASAYSSLRAFRDRHPDIPVILVSNEFAKDDFGTSRLALCDISLRAPFTFAMLGFALREAKVNNTLWQKRLLDVARLKKNED